MLLICGGPSPERNISLNSARSVYDHLENDFNIEIIFIDKEKNYFSINGSFLYSNTTSDFDFKLKNEGILLTNDEFLNKLKEHDIVLPIMHGIFAEDGQIQKIFENQKVAFIGSGSKTCNQIYNKKNANDFLIKNGYFTVPKLFLQIERNKLSDFDIEKIYRFFEDNSLNESIVKPVEGGSSFGVKHARNIDETINICEEMSLETRDVLVEQRCIGKEFTVMVIQNKKGEPVSLIPTEIEVKDSDNIIFDTRRKYLATNETHYHCPPTFDKSITDKIRNEVENLFSMSGAKDFLRIDGWVFNSGDIYFSDFNPISGMEQNSFIFQQSSKIGMNHKEILEYIIESCSYRNNINIHSKKSEEKNLDNRKKQINVLFGGSTAERQVSLLSGSNVWLKLQKSKKFNATPFLLFKENVGSDDSPENFKVLKLPYYMVLNHTVEEILYQFHNHEFCSCKDENLIRSRLGLEEKNIEIPTCMTLLEFVQMCKQENSYVFLGLHGGFGENGGIQDLLEKESIKFNGSDKETSKLCMNKYETSKFIDSLKIKSLRSAKSLLVSTEDLINNKYSWNCVCRRIGSKAIIKPNRDGSSTGVVLLENKNYLLNYVNILKNKSTTVPKNTFGNKSSINLGINSKEYIIEEYIKTDSILASNGHINLNKETGWIELTVGVLEKEGKYHSLNPSITIYENNSILSLEEKFQGGTGINITPPPENIVDNKLLKTIKEKIEEISRAIKIKDYARIDIFVNVISKEIIVIEFNTLPALTPSTVLFQQSSKEDNKLSPLELIETIITNKEMLC